MQASGSPLVWEACVRACARFQSYVLFKGDSSMPPFKGLLWEHEVELVKNVQIM